MTLKLTNALNRILSWLQKNESYYVEYLQPGLSKTEIEQIVQDLPFTISEEIYELYQWRNGAIEGEMGIAALFGGWSFYPLQEIVSNYKKAKEEHQKSIFQKIPFVKLSDFEPYMDNFTPLKVFQHFDESRHRGAVWLNQNLDFHPVIFDYFEQGDFEVTRIYTSLTSMMQTIAECYETGAYYIDLDLLQIGHFVNHNIEKEEIIWHKYNSQLIEFALQALNQKTFSGWFFAHFSEILIKFKDLRVVKLLIESLETLDNSSSFPLRKDPLMRGEPKANIINILGEIGDISALEVISRFSEDENYLISEAARSALIKLRPQDQERR